MWFAPLNGTRIARSTVSGTNLSSIIKVRLTFTGISWSRAVFRPPKKTKMRATKERPSQSDRCAAWRKPPRWGGGETQKRFVTYRNIDGSSARPFRPVRNPSLRRRPTNVYKSGKYSGRDNATRRRRRTSEDLPNDRRAERWPVGGRETRRRPGSWNLCCRSTDDGR